MFEGKAKVHIYRGGWFNSSICEKVLGFLVAIISCNLGYIKENDHMYSALVRPLLGTVV